MPDTNLQYLSFAVSEVTCAVGVLAIREIIECRAVTPVPTLPPAVRGVINLRGMAVPVIDLAVRFGREPGPLTPLSCLVIVTAELDGEPTAAGLLVDSVSDLVDELTLEPVPEFGTAVPAELLTGVASLDGRLACVLDVGRVLAVNVAGKRSPDVTSPVEGREPTPPHAA